MRAGDAPATLRESCVRTLARCLHTVSKPAFMSIVWPEECLLELLQTTLQLGRLNEHSAHLFLEAAKEHQALARQLDALNLRPVPPRVGASGRWLGGRVQPSSCRMEDEGYAPRQYSRDGGLQEATDFRSLAKSLDKSSIPNRDPGHASGGKRKRDETQAAPQAAPVDAMDADGGAGIVDVPFAKRRAFDNTSGKVSHRPWKVPFSRASAVAVRPPSDWDRKMREKEQKKVIQRHVAEVRTEAKEAAAAERKRRAEVQKRKEENRKKAAIVQKISNPKKLKALSKKKKARLVTIPDTK